MIIRQNTVKEEYDAFDSIGIRNPSQAARFVKHGAKLCDIYLSKDGDKFVYVFTKSEIAPLMEKWNRYELQ